MSIFKTTILVTLGTVLLASTVHAQQPASTNQGPQIYAAQCASCHGDTGQGTDQYHEALHGDRSVSDLARYISDEMPEDNPHDCVAPQADEVAKYIFEQFYSASARTKNNQTRVEFSHLTVRQYQESVADLIGSFSDPAKPSADQGLSAKYFAARNENQARKLAASTADNLDFGDGVPHFDATGKYPQVPEPEKKANKVNDGFSAYWNGSVIAAETGAYEFTVETRNGFQLWINDHRQPILDREVRSDDTLKHSTRIFLLGGRSYPFRLRLIAVTDPPAKVRMLWTPPGGINTIIPAASFSTRDAPESLAISTPFPPDDSSDGYERGTSVSQQWDAATTDAAIDTANWITSRLWQLARTTPSAKDRTKKVKSFCLQFVQRAFNDQLSPEEQTRFVDQHFDNDLPVFDQVTRVVVLALKSPRFLYPAASRRDRQFETAGRLANTLWDSIPDAQLSKLATTNKLLVGDELNEKRLNREVDRMIADPRSHAKLRSFFHYWLVTEKAASATKDKRRYPNFDQQLQTDLKRSLDLYLDDVAWSQASDFRELFLADYLYLNPRLAKFYGIQTSATGFEKTKVDPLQRAGILTHPYLMAGLAYHKDSSPIHRGVFIARNLLGRQLRQPPEAFAPLTEDFNPTLTNRQRVEHQTKETACMNCHSVINPLGFSLENIDAVGRFRTADKKKPIDAMAIYEPLVGEAVQLAGPRDLAEYLVADATAQRAFIGQLFRYYTKQPIDAYGTDQLDRLHTQFVADNFNMRNLIKEIVLVVVTHDDKN